MKGEFVGGSDIMMEMFESGELQQLVAAGADYEPKSKGKGGTRDQKTAAPHLLIWLWNQVDANCVTTAVPTATNSRNQPKILKHTAWRPSDL